MVLRIETSIFVLISLSIVLTAGNDVKEDGDREAHSDRQGLWFGPRLGKRSPQNEEDNRDLYLRMMEAAEALKYYYNQLPVSLLERSEPDTRVTKKVIFTPKLGRSLEEERGIVDFTPRLGRRLSDDMAVTQHYDSYRNDESGGGRVRFFSPRLGRTVNFNPRLGRELTYDDYPSVRVARSVNNTKNSRH